MTRKRSRPSHPIARRDDLAVRVVDGETLVYDLQRHRAHCLEAVVAAVWRHCDGRSSPAEIARRVAEETGVALPAGAVPVALHRLHRARLLEGAPAPPEAGRREWLKRAAGLAGLAVVSIAAPTPVDAATCVPLGTCEQPGGPGGGDCTTNFCCPGPGVPASGRCCRQGPGACQCRNTGACDH